MPCFGAPNFYGLKEGRHSLTVWSVDRAYNRSVPVRYVWRIDRTAPVLSLLGGPTEGSTGSTSEVTFNVAQSEKGQLWCSLDGVQFTTCRSPIRFADLSSGAHSFAVYAVDAAGNQSVTVSRGWSIS